MINVYNNNRDVNIQYTQTFAQNLPQEGYISICRLDLNQQTELKYIVCMYVCICVYMVN